MFTKSRISIYSYVYMCRLVLHTQILLFCVLRRSQSNDIPITTRRSSSQVLTSNTCFNKRNQDSLEKWLILGLKQEIFKINLEHTVMPKSKDVSPYQDTMMGCVKGAQKASERAPRVQSLPSSRQFEQQNSVILQMKAWNKYPWIFLIERKD